MGLQGLPAREIAAEIRLSPYTVQDHLKVIFEKTSIVRLRGVTEPTPVQGRFPRGRSGLHDDAVEFVARQLSAGARSVGFYEWSGRTFTSFRSNAFASDFEDKAQRGAVTRAR
jgi:hypothetical protein